MQTEGAFPTLQRLTSTQFTKKVHCWGGPHRLAALFQQYFIFCSGKKLYSTWLHTFLTIFDHCDNKMLLKSSRRCERYLRYRNPTSCLDNLMQKIFMARYEQLD